MCTTKPVFASKTKKRLTLSDIEQPFYCSIVGTCLTLDELRKLADDLSLPAAESDYDLHVAFIELANHNAKVNRILNKKLDRKFRRTIARFRTARSEQDLLSLWCEARREGKIPGAYWATLTHPEATGAVIGQAFGDIHMLSHLSGASRRVDIRELRRLERESEQQCDEIAALRKSLHANQHELRLRTKDLEDVRAHAAELSDTCSALRRQNEALQSNDASRLREQLQTTIKRLERVDLQFRHAERDRHMVQQRLTESEDRERERARECEELRGDIQALERELSRALGAGFASDRDSARLHGHSVLYVGGRTHLVARYREVVERRGAVFIHHDGGSDDDRLTEHVSRADIVCCPVDCVSHNACLRVKRCCRRLSKGCAFLRSSGLSALVGHLDAVSHTVAPASVGTSTGFGALAQSVGE